MRLKPVFRFGDFEFDPEIPLLTRGSRSLDLSPKALRVLAVLVQNAGRVVSKDDLLDIVWKGAAVEEGNLAVHIFALRKALGGHAIENIPKRGYRFAEPVDSAREGYDWCTIAAYYLQQQTIDACRRAAGEYRQCLKTQPSNVKAKAGLANTFLFRFVLGDLSGNEAIPHAIALLQDASRMDSSCPDVHLSQSRLFGLGHWQWQQAQEELQQTLELTVNSDTRYLVQAWQGCHLVERGELDTGLQLLQAAHTACPLSPFLSRFTAEAHFLARDFSGCVALTRQSLQLHPHCWLLYRVLGRALTALGEYEEAGQSIRRAALLYDAPQSGLAADLAYLDAIAGRQDRARKLLSPASSGLVSFVSLAQVHTALGNKDRALECLEQACASREWSLSSIKQDHRFDPLRAENRFRVILTQVGI